LIDFFETLGGVRGNSWMRTPTARAIALATAEATVNNPPLPKPITLAGARLRKSNLLPKIRRCRLSSSTDVANKSPFANSVTAVEK
jgi:hypothetical protein